MDHSAKKPGAGVTILFTVSLIFCLLLAAVNVLGGILWILFLPLGV
jgi:hypothetical protein